MSTNGAGLGHLTRCLAYARQMTDNVKPIFFSLASAVDLIEKMGFAADYFVSPNWSAASSAIWNQELCVRLGIFLEQVRPEVIVFDGTWPYQGFVAACKRYGDAKLVWSSRGLYQYGKETQFPDLDLFDLIIRPSEIGESRCEVSYESGKREMVIPPVCVLNDDELLERAQARTTLGLSQDSKYALFSLGAGNINNLSGMVPDLIHHFRADGVEVLWAKNPMSHKDLVLPDGVRSISEYPLARYLRAFDVFVGAAGYNTCCEVVQTQVPSLLIPNVETALDDQYKRAMLVAQCAPAVVSFCTNEAERKDAVASVMMLAKKSKSEDCLQPMNGAKLAASAIIDLMN